MRAKTGVMIRVIDMNALANEALTIQNTQYTPNRPATRMTTTYDVGIVETPGGAFAIDADGVGGEITETMPLIIAFYPEWVDVNGRKTLSAMPTVTAVINVSRLPSVPIMVERDLADHIRTFGARLESNFLKWKETLENAQRVRRVAQAEQPRMGQ